ncbi:unnamed protein product, partial [Didymodactylos carnosus]
MLNTYNSNVIGPWKVTKVFLPLLKKSVKSNQPHNAQQSSIIMISSLMSSMELAKSFPFFAYDYQCSKAALNMFTVCMAKEWEKKGIFIALVHPGWVRTDMGGDSADLDIDTATTNIVECLQSLKAEHYGRLIDSTQGSNITIFP